VQQKLERKNGSKDRWWVGTSWLLADPLLYTRKPRQIVRLTQEKDKRLGHLRADEKGSEAKEEERRTRTCCSAARAWGRIRMRRRREKRRGERCRKPGATNCVFEDADASSSSPVAALLAVRCDSQFQWIGPGPFVG